jgi:uncharacterized protein YciW
MARMKKQSSPKIDQAATRAAGLKSIDATLDLGNGMTLTAYQAAITDAQGKLAAYNTKLSEVDEAQNAFSVAEKNIADLSERMLAGTAARYGKNSDQYEMAGGTRKSERKRRAAKPAVVATG